MSPSLLLADGISVRLKNDNEVTKVNHMAIAEGIIFIDTTWDYHEGRSEELLVEALTMGGRQEQVFLMTKVCNRDYAGAMHHL